MDSRDLCFDPSGALVNNESCTQEKHKRQAQDQTCLDQATRIVIGSE